MERKDNIQDANGPKQPRQRVRITTARPTAYGERPQRPYGERPQYGRPQRPQYGERTHEERPYGRPQRHNMASLSVLSMASHLMADLRASRKIGRVMIHRQNIL